MGWFLLKLEGDYPGEALYINGVGSQGDKEKMNIEERWELGQAPELSMPTVFLLSAINLGIEFIFFGFSRELFQLGALLVLFAI
jgi:hypothetical protein